MLIGVAGVGIVAPIGVGRAAFTEGLRRGRSGFAPPTLLPDDTGAPVAEILQDPRPALRSQAQAVGMALPRRHGRTVLLAACAVAEALHDAGLTVGDLGRTGLVVGTSTAGTRESEQRRIARDAESYWREVTAWELLSTPPGATASALARLLGLTGPVATVSTACSSSALTIGQGVEWLRQGRCDRVIAVGADALCRLTLVGFSSLKLLDPERPRPFDAGRQGTSLGEAAAALILAPGHDLRGSVRGWGAIAEAHHPVQPRADGDGARRAMAAALADAGLDPAAVDCVNAHATATPANDLAEARGIESLLPPVPVSGSKSQLGHSLGAAGAVEAVVALLALEGGFVPPTVGLRQLDGDIGVDVVTQARPFSGGLALSNSFAFGGNDVSLCLAARGWS